MMRDRNARIDALAENGIHIILRYGPAGVGGWYAQDTRRRRFEYGGRRDDAIALGEGMLQTRDMALPKRITPLDEGIEIAQSMIETSVPEVPDGYHLRVTADGHVWFAYGAGIGETVLFGTLAEPDADGYRDLQPTDDFWQAWRNNGHQVRDLCGFRANRVRGRWHVYWKPYEGATLVIVDTDDESVSKSPPAAANDASPHHVDTFRPDEGAFEISTTEAIDDYQQWLGSLSTADFIEAICEKELAGGRPPRQNATADSVRPGGGNTSADSDYHAYLKRNGGS